MDLPILHQDWDDNQLILPVRLERGGAVNVWKLLFGLRYFVKGENPALLFVEFESNAIETAIYSLWIGHSLRIFSMTLGVKTQ